MRHKFLFACAVALTLPTSPALAAADPDPAAVSAGMTAAPCPPRQSLPDVPLAEPGHVPAYDPELIAKYFADAKAREASDWAWLCRYRSANGEIAASRPPEVVFMGDSVTENWVRYDPGFFAKGNVGRGISGQTSPQMLVRFYQDVIALRPRAVHIMAGTNDVAGNTGPTSPEAYRFMIRSMVELAKANKIEVILASIPPAKRFPWKPALEPASMIVALNDWLRTYARETGSTYADYYTMLAMPDGGLKPEFAYDGVHPGTAGYAAMRRVAQRAISRALPR